MVLCFFSGLGSNNLVLSAILSLTGCSNLQITSVFKQHVTQPRNESISTQNSKNFDPAEI